MNLVFFLTFPSDPSLFPAFPALISATVESFSYHSLHVAIGSALAQLRLLWWWPSPFAMFLDTEMTHQALCQDLLQPISDQYAMMMQEWWSYEFSGYISGLYDTCMILVWYLHDTCMILVWYLYDTCMIVSAKHAMFFLGDFGPGARPGAEPGGPMRGGKWCSFLLEQVEHLAMLQDELRAHFWWLRYIWYQYCCLYHHSW